MRLTGLAGSLRTSGDHKQQPTRTATCVFGSFPVFLQGYSGMRGRGGGRQTEGSKRAKRAKRARDERRERWNDAHAAQLMRERRPDISRELGTRKGASYYIFASHVQRSRQLEADEGDIGLRLSLRIMCVSISARCLVPFARLRIDVCIIDYVCMYLGARKKESNPAKKTRVPPHRGG